MAHPNDGTSDKGRRVVKAAAKDWTCSKADGGCGKAVRYYWTSCPNCSSRRPD